MSELSDNPDIAALTFNVPQKVGWSIQSNNQSWTGGELTGLVDCLSQKAKGTPATLSLSLFFEFER